MNRTRITKTKTVAIVKGTERYVFVFDDAHRGECLRMLGKFASNHELSFDWYDAARLAAAVRKRDSKGL